MDIIGILAVPRKYVDMEGMPIYNGVKLHLFDAYGGFTKPRD